MCEIDANNHNNEESVSVEIPEADFLNERARAEAMQKLISMTDSHGDEFERPQISAVRAVVNVTVPLAASAAIFCILYFTLPAHRLAASLGVSLGALGLYVIVRMRAILIWFIRVYQRFAPDEVRRRCVFTPTCSQYAIQALQRYGVIRGVPKIIKRLLRCHLPNGGNDPLK